MKFRNISLKGQFVLIILLITMPFILLAVYNLSEEKRKESEHAKNLAISLARNIGIQQKNSEASTRQMLSLIAKLPELQLEELNSEMLNLLFKDVLSENPQFAVVLAALPNGDAYAAAIPFKPFSISDRKYYKDVLRTRSFSVGEFAKSRLTNRAVLHYAMPVIDFNNNNIKLILIASFDLAQYQNILSVSTLHEGSDFAFYDYAGRLLYHSRNQQKYLGKRGSPEIQQAIGSLTGEGAYYSEGEDGSKRLYGFIRINIENDSPYMYVVVSTPLSKAFNNADNAFYRNIALSILAVLIGLFISLYYKNFIFKNVDKLVKIANQFKDGDLTARTNVDYSLGETGSLARALDTMAESMQNRETERDLVHKNLQVLTERFEIAVNSAKIGIWEWDLLTHKVFWDQQMYVLYNTESLNFKGSLPYWMKYIHPEDSVRFEEELHHSIRYKKPHKTSFRIKTDSKDYKNIRCYFNIISDKNGKAIRVTGVNWDITERILLETELTLSKEEIEEKVSMLKSELEKTLSSMRQKLTLVIETTDKIADFDTKNELISLKKNITQWGNDSIEELNSIFKKLH